MKKSPGVASFIAPRYWPIWLALGLLRIVVAFPQSLRMKVGKVFGFLLYAFGKKRCQIADANLKACFPEKSSQWRQDVIRKHFDSLGMALVETGMCWWTSDAELLNLTSVYGIENLEQALARGKGVILLGGHFTSIELGLRLLKPKTDATIYPVYQRHKNPLLEHVITSNRLTHAEAVITHNDVRGMIRALKKNGALWYAPDQAYKGKHSELVPFFKVLAPSNTGTSRIAKITGAAVIPLFMRRTSDAMGYELHLLPALENFPTDDTVADTQRYHQLMEKAILEAPEQYLWVHKRFKGRPTELENIYEDI